MVRRNHDPRGLGVIDAIVQSFPRDCDEFTRFFAG
jgi:hypothetical protein